MKTLNIIIMGILIPLLGFSQVKVTDESKTKPDKLKGTVKVMAAPELFEVSSMWVEDFDAQHDQLKVKITKTESMEEDRILPAGTDIRILYDDNNTMMYQEDVTPIILGREISVAVINPDNPFRDILLQKGVTVEKLDDLLNSSESYTWGHLMENDEDRAIGFIHSESALGLGGGVLEAVKKDPYSLAYCKMANILDDSGKSFDQGVILLPVDKNSNGIIDSQEDIYENYESFTRGVWIGKYPQELYRKIYSLSKANQTNESVVAFLEWIVTSGQQSLLALGYDDIVYNEKRTNLNALFITETKPAASRNLYAGQKVFAFIICLFIVTGLLANFAVRLFARKRSGAYSNELSPIPVFDVDSLKHRKGFHFDKSHTWAFMGEDGLVKIGIDDFLQHVTGPITRVKMKLPGERIKKGDRIFSIIQRGKRLNIYSPVSGIIKKHNQDLEVSSTLINTSPYSEGWVYLVEPTNWMAEIHEMLMGQKYMTWLKNELIRLKDFLASSLSLKYYNRAGIVLQEGGELRDGVLDECGPEIWEEFQANFIDTKE